MSVAPKALGGVAAAILLAAHPGIFLIACVVAGFIAAQRWLEARRRRRPKQLPPPPAPIHTIPIEERERYHRE